MGAVAHLQMKDESVEVDAVDADVEVDAVDADVKEEPIDPELAIILQRSGL